MIQQQVATQRGYNEQGEQQLLDAKYKTRKDVATYTGRM